MYCKIPFQHQHFKMAHNKLLIYLLTNWCWNEVIFTEPWKPSQWRSAFYIVNPILKHPTNSLLQTISFFFFYFLIPEELENLSFPTSRLLSLPFVIHTHRQWLSLVIALATASPNLPKQGKVSQLPLKRPLSWLSEVNRSCHFLADTSMPSHTASFPLSLNILLSESFQ